MTLAGYGIRAQGYSIRVWAHKMELFFTNVIFLLVLEHCTLLLLEHHHLHCNKDIQFVKDYEWWSSLLMGNLLMVCLVTFLLSENRFEKKFATILLL